VGKGGGEVGGADEHVHVVEVGAPGGPGGHAPVLVLDHLRERRQVVARVLVGEEQPQVEPERLGLGHRVDALGPALDHGRAGPGHGVHRVREHGADLAGGRGVVVVEDHADPGPRQAGVRGGARAQR
jgi:hypothetical protein